MDVAYEEKITKILTAAAAAPSGDNSQPWRFVVHESSIEFHFLPEKDNPILNYEEGGTLIALGAALQNAELEARATGYEPEVTFCENGPCVAIMELKEGGRLDEGMGSLQQAIFKRHSNRKAYKKIPLSPEVKSALLDSRISGHQDLKLSLIESSESMKEVSRALTTMEETALGNQALHELFFGDILWSEAENREGKQGLYIKTLELPPPAEAGFRLLKHWRFAKLLAQVGFPKVVAKTNALQNASASAFGVITVAHTSRAMYLETGKMLERIWLLATSRGLSVQIVTGITFLAQSMKSPETAKLFSPLEQERISAAYATIKRNVDGTSEPVIIFRIGTGDSPTEVSYRQTPDILYT